MPKNPSPYSPDCWIFEYTGEAFSLFVIEPGDMVGIRVKNESYKEDFFHSGYTPSPLDPDDIKNNLRIYNK